MPVLLKNGSRSASVKISLHRLFNAAKLYSKSLSPQKTIEVHVNDLKKNPEGLDPGAVLLAVKTPHNQLIWKGPVPVSSDSIPIKINAETKKVYYGKRQLPSLVAPPPSVSFNVSVGCFLVFLVFIILLWLLVGRAKKSR